MELDDPAGYGRVVRREDGSVERVVETKVAGRRDRRASSPSARSTPASTPSTAAALKDALERLTPDNAQGELYLPSTLELLDRVAAHRARRPHAAARRQRPRRPRARARARPGAASIAAHMRAGVTIVDPASTLDRRHGRDRRRHRDRAVVASCAARRPIGERCTVGPLTTLIDTALGDEVRVPHSYLVECEVRAGASVGPVRLPAPRARCCASARRPAPSSRSRTPTSARAPRSRTSATSATPTSGPNTNLGAATITANYDGSRKHRTTIGADVRTSVDTTLVAPVTIGDGAYTGARTPRSPRTCRPAPSGSRASARPTSRATPSARRSARRRTHRRDPRVD